MKGKLARACKGQHASGRNAKRGRKGHIDAGIGNDSADRAWVARELGTGRQALFGCPAVGSARSCLRTWRKWQTRQVEGLVRVNRVEVQVLSSALASSRPAWQIGFSSRSPVADARPIGRVQGLKVAEIYCAQHDARKKKPRSDGGPSAAQTPGPGAQHDARKIEARADLAQAHCCQGAEGESRTRTAFTATRS